MDQIDSNLLKYKDLVDSKWLNIEQFIVSG